MRRSDARLEALWRSRAPWPRSFEYLPAALLAAFSILGAGSSRLAWPTLAYLAYLVVDRTALPPRRLTKYVRSAAAVAYPMAHCWMLARPLGLPAVPAPLAIGVVVGGALLPFALERARHVTAFIRGLVLAILAEFLVQFLAPDGLGPHVALPLFAAVWAFEWRSVAWRATAPLLLAWAVAVPIGYRMGVDNYLSHAIAGLIAWFIADRLPEGRARPSGARGDRSGSGTLPEAAER